MRMMALTILLSYFIADPLPAGLHSNVITQAKKPIW
jgi:hypothetical protein